MQPIEEIKKSAENAVSSGAAPQTIVNKTAFVLWDYDSTPMSGTHEAGKIIKALRNIGVNVNISITAFLKVMPPSQTTLTNSKLFSHRIGELQAHNVDIVPVNPFASTVEKMIIERLTPEKYAKNDMCIMITNNTNFTPFMERLAQVGVSVLLFYGKDSKANFIDNPSWKSHAFNTLLKSVPTLDPVNSSIVPGNNVIAWWDYDNLPVPRRYSVNEVVDQIFIALKKYGKDIDLTVFTNTYNIPGDALKLLLRESKRLKINSAYNASQSPTQRSEPIDNEIIVQMAPEKRINGDVCVLISDDSGFHRHLMALTLKNFQVVLFHSPRTRVYKMLTQSSFFKSESLSFLGEGPGNYFERLEVTSGSADPGSAAGETEHDAKKQTEITATLTQEPTKELRICKHFSSRGCTIKTCRFQHICSICNASDHGMSNCPKNENKTSFCLYFADHYCSKGNTCVLSHTCYKCKTPGEYLCINCNKDHLKIYGYIPNSIDPLANSKFIIPERCNPRFFCQSGITCTNYHLPVEIRSFRRNKGKGFSAEKTQSCTRVHNAEIDKQKCSYAHDISERVCYYCATRGDHTNSFCPERTKEKKELIENLQRAETQPPESDQKNQTELTALTQTSTTIIPPVETTPKSVEVLQCENTELQQKYAELQKENARLQLELQVAREELAKYKALSQIPDSHIVTNNQFAPILFSKTTTVPSQSIVPIGSSLIHELQATPQPKQASAGKKPSKLNAKASAWNPSSS